MWQRKFHVTFFLNAIQRKFMWSESSYKENHTDHKSISSFNTYLQYH